LRRQYDGIREEVLAAIARVCDSQSFILGPEVEALESEIADADGSGASPSVAPRERKLSGWRWSPPA
jgi:dTDP-4-amino-4,6-dideoxygalactose transaminase